MRKDKTREVLGTLRTYESRNVTYQDPDGVWPIVWDRAKDCRVWDLQGRSYLDMTAAFGVVAAGHGNVRVVRAGQRQMGRLLHAMGDVHPHRLKGELMRELSQLTFGRWSAGRIHGKTILGLSGFEAVEAALKTARLATGKDEVVAFHGAYHGVGYGTLNVTHREHFRGPFRSQMREFGRFVPFPDSFAPRSPVSMADSLAAVEKLLRSDRVGAVLVEPMQARGGIRIPSSLFLQGLRKLCDRFQALLIVDEIYTGFGRTGRWFAVEHSKVIPDLICLGKALTGGFPLSACVGRADLMDAAWPVSQGEAIHTSTYLGHPVGCAMALAQIQELHRLNLIQQSAEMGLRLLRSLKESLRSRGQLKIQISGSGLMVGVALYRRNGAPATEECLAAVKALLQEGILVLPEGETAHVIGLTPPLTLNTPDLMQVVKSLKKVLLPT